MEQEYVTDYNIYMLAGEDITKKKYIEENYNNEDFVEWICLNQYHAQATKPEET